MRPVLIRLKVDDDDNGGKRRREREGARDRTFDHCGKVRSGKDTARCFQGGGGSEVVVIS